MLLLPLLLSLRRFPGFYSIPPSVFIAFLRSPCLVPIPFPPLKKVHQNTLGGASTSTDIIFFFLILTRGYFFIALLERGREREKHWYEGETSIGCLPYDPHMIPNWGSNSQPRYMPWLGIKPVTFWGMGWCSNQLSYLARTKYQLLKDTVSLQKTNEREN